MSKCGEVSEIIVSTKSKFIDGWCANALDAIAPAINSVAINFFMLFPFFKMRYYDCSLLAECKHMLKLE